MAHLGLWLTTLLLCCQDIQSPNPHVRSVARPGCHRPFRLGRVGTRKMGYTGDPQQEGYQQWTGWLFKLFPIFSSLIYFIQNMRLGSKIGQGFVSSEIKTLSQHVICSVELFCFFSPPARWGLLDFIRVVLLRLLRQFLLDHVCINFHLHFRLANSSPSSSPTSQLSAHCWTSTWDLPSAVRTAGPQPGTFPAQCAPLDLNGQIECQKICQIECQKICQIECQKICQ